MIRVNVLAFLLLFEPLVWAQDIYIRVLNAKNGHPIRDECLNISLGKWHGAELFGQTNPDGVITLHVDGKQVTVETNSQRACNTEAVVGPKFFANDERSISVSGDIYVACQEYRKPASKSEIVPPGELIPNYPISKILESGIAAANTCGKFKAEAKPGELILFSRPRTLWEWMKL